MVAPEFKRRIAMTRHDIISTVARVWETTPANMRQQRRFAEIVKPRHMAIFLIKQHHLYSSLGEIAREFGMKSHATIINAANAHQSFMVSDNQYKQRFGDVQKMLSFIDDMFNTEIYPRNEE